MFILASSVLAEPTRPEPNARVLGNLRAHAGQLFTAATVWHELFYGVWRLPPSKRRTALRDYLDQLAASELTLLPYDQRAAEWHGRERARLQSIGKTPPYADSQIAAVAVVNGMTLVTHNTDDFAAFSELRVVDWTAKPVGWSPATPRLRDQPFRGSWTGMPAFARGTTSTFQARAAALAASGHRHDGALQLTGRTPAR